MSKVVYLDFEFSGVTEEFVNLVSCVTLTFDSKHAPIVRRWWLHNDLQKQKELAEYLSRFTLVVAYSAVAEARSYLSLKLDPLEFQWYDGFLEYRMLTNHNDALQWGKQLVDGKVKTVRKPKPKWERTEEEGSSGFSATHSLAEATFKLTGAIRDTEHKKKIRDLIISNPKKFTKEERNWILEYNEEDVVHLPEIRERLEEEFFKLRPSVSRDEYLREARWRGRYAAHTAIMESKGYPLDMKKAKNFSKQVENIMFDVQREINELFPEIKPFRWNKKEQRFSWDQKITKSWIRQNHDEDRWMKTDGGDLALSLDAWERFYTFRHDYPTDNFGAQMLRFLKLKQSLYGFSTKKGGKDNKSFWDYVGSDGRVRPYMNIYKAQSSRSQPASKGFMFLKPAWMRALVQPARGTFMAGIDYASQEFFAAALLAEDTNMINAYLSGDPYLALAKMTGAVPPDATKDSHKAERNLFKATTLGISYLMSKYGLANKLTADTGRVWTEDEAQEQIDLFYGDEAFWRLKEWQEETLDNYIADRYIKLPDGWYMFGDNENHRSVANVPVQGIGACAMRKAVDIAASEFGLYIPFTLHDALYMEDKVGNEKKILDLEYAMREGFALQFPKHLQDTARKIRLDPFAWSPNYKKDSEMKVGHLTVPCSNLYLDERATSDFYKFSQYFEDRHEDCL